MRSVPSLGWLLLLPLLELVSLFGVGRVLGTLPTLIWLVFDVWIGVRMMRGTGIRLADLLSGRQRLEQGMDEELLAVLARALAGLLLAIPGPITDLMAAGLLWPGLLRRWLGSKAPASSASADPMSRPPPAGPTVIDGEWERIDEDPPRRP